MPATIGTETTREGLFASTRWTMVIDAGESQTPPAQALSALSELCRIYWRPIFLFLRRQGSNPDDAQDLTQGFFAHLIESRGMCSPATGLSKARPSNKFARASARERC